MHFVMEDVYIHENCIFHQPIFFKQVTRGRGSKDFAFYLCTAPFDLNVLPIIVLSARIQSLKTTPTEA